MLLWGRKNITKEIEAKNRRGGKNSKWQHNCFIWRIGPKFYNKTLPHLSARSHTNNMQRFCRFVEPMQ